MYVKRQGKDRPQTIWMQTLILSFTEILLAELIDVAPVMGTPKEGNVLHSQMKVLKINFKTLTYKHISDSDISFILISDKTFPFVSLLNSLQPQLHEFLMLVITSYSLLTYIATLTETLYTHLTSFSFPVEHFILRRR